MKIEKIEIKGLFGKKDICWKLNPQVNVLVGVNGSGKSTILSVIHSFLLQVIPHKIEELIHSSNMYFSCGKIELKIKEEKPAHELLKDFTSSEEFHKLKKENPKLVDIFISSLKSQKTFKASNYHAIGELGKVFFNKEKHFYFDLIEANISNVHANQNLDLRTRPNINPIDIEIQDTIDELNKIKTDELITQLSGSLNVFFNQIGKHVSYENNELVYTDTQLQQKLNYSHLSSGERQLIYILLRVALSNGDKSKTAIILMDEPEISLHVTWQRHFINQLILLNPDAQFIIVTHSPAITMNGWNDVYVSMKEITQ